MRIALTTGLFCLISGLPAAAATCPGNIIFQDSFAKASTLLDTGAYPQSKITIEGGKATVNLLQSGMARVEQYWGNRYGDVNVCVSVGTTADDKAENEIAGVVFWAVDYNSYYDFQINATNGQFNVAQRLPSGQWGMPVSWTASPAIAQGMGKANALRVQTKGNTATLFINDQQVGTVTGTLPAGGGQVGFFGQGDGTDTLEFTNFTVTSTQSSTSLPTSAACPGTAVFTDQFAAGDTYLNLPATASSQVSVAGGKGQIVLSQANYGQAVQYSGNQFGDSNICATFSTLATDKPEKQMAGIQFWASDYANTYMFLINATTGEYQIAQKSGGNWTMIMTAVPNAAVVKGMGKANTLRVQTKGNSAWLYINNQLLGSLVGAAPAGGGLVGFYAQSDTSYTAKETWEVSNLTVAVP